VHIIICSIIYNILPILGVYRFTTATVNKLYFNSIPASKRFYFNLYNEHFPIEKVAVTRQSPNKRKNINAICHFSRDPFILLQDTNVKVVVHRL